MNNTLVKQSIACPIIDTEIRGLSSGEVTIPTILQIHFKFKIRRNTRSREKKLEGTLSSSRGAPMSRASWGMGLTRKTRRGQLMYPSPSVLRLRLDQYPVEMAIVVSFRKKDMSLHLDQTLKASLELTIRV